MVPTRDHDNLRAWAAKHNAVPAQVKPIIFGPQPAICTSSSEEHKGVPGARAHLLGAILRYLRSARARLCLGRAVSEAVLNSASDYRLVPEGTSATVWAYPGVPSENER